MKDDRQDIVKNISCLLFFYKGSDFMHDEVMQFINYFKKDYSKELEDMFINGWCYWFALILKERFDGEILYVPVYVHFITRIDGKCYDIKGLVISEDILNLAQPWEEYKIFDSADSTRIEYYCINKYES